MKNNPLKIFVLLSLILFLIPEVFSETDFIKKINVLNFEGGILGVDTLYYSIGTGENQTDFYIITRGTVLFVLRYECDESFQKNFTLEMFFVDNLGRFLEGYPYNSTLLDCSASSKMVRIAIDFRKVRQIIGTIKFKATIPDDPNYVKFVHTKLYFYYLDPNNANYDLIISHYHVLGEGQTIPFKINFLGTVKLVDENGALFGDNERKFVLQRIDDLSRVNFQFEGNFSFNNIPDGNYRLKAIFVPLLSNVSIEKDLHVIIDKTPPNLTSLEISTEAHSDILLMPSYYNLTPYLNTDVFGSKDAPLERYIPFLFIRGEAGERLKDVYFDVSIFDENDPLFRRKLDIIERLTTLKLSFNLEGNISLKDLEGEINIQENASVRSRGVSSDIIKVILEESGMLSEKCQIVEEKKFQCSVMLYDSTTRDNKPNLVTLTFCDHNKNCKMKLFYFRVISSEDWKVEFMHQQPNILPYDVIMYGAEGTIVLTLTPALPYFDARVSSIKFSFEEDEMRKYIHFLDNIDLRVTKFLSHYSREKKELSIMLRFYVKVKDPDRIDFTKLPDHIITYLRIRISGSIERSDGKTVEKLVVVPVALRVESPLFSAKFLNPQNLDNIIRDLNTTLRILNESLKWVTEASKWIFGSCLGFFFSSLMMPGNEGLGNTLYQGMIATCERFVCTPVPDVCKFKKVDKKVEGAIEVEYDSVDTQGYRTIMKVFANCSVAKKAISTIECDESSSDSIIVEEYIKEDKGGLYSIHQRKVYYLPQEQKKKNMDQMCNDAYRLKSAFLINYILNFVNLCERMNNSVSYADKIAIAEKIINRDVEYKKLTFTGEFRNFLNQSFSCENATTLMSCVVFVVYGDNLEYGFNISSPQCKSLLMNNAFDYENFTLGNCTNSVCNISIVGEGSQYFGVSSEMIKACQTPEALNNLDNLMKSLIRQDPSYYGKGECYNTEYPDYHQYRCLLNVFNPINPIYIGDPGENALSSIFCGCFPTARGYLDALMKNVELIKECLESVKRGKYAAAHCELIAGIYACDFFMDLGISIYEWINRKRGNEVTEIKIDELKKNENKTKDEIPTVDCSKNPDHPKCKEVKKLFEQIKVEGSTYHIVNFLKVTTGNKEREEAIKQRYSMTLSQFITPNVKHQLCVFTVTGLVLGVWDFGLLFDLYGKEYEKKAIKRNPQAWLPAGYWTIISYDPIKRMPIVRYNLAVQIIGGTKSATYELYLVCDPDVQDPPAEWCGGERLDILVKSGVVPPMKTVSLTEVIDNSIFLSHPERSEDRKLERYLFNKVKLVMKYYDVNKEAEATWVSEIALDKKTAIEICDISWEKTAGGKFAGVYCKNPYYEYDKYLEIPRGARTAFITRHKVLSVPKLGNPNEAELRLEDSLIVGFEFEVDPTLEKLEDSYLFVNVKKADGTPIQNFTYLIKGSSMKNFFKITGEESVMIPLQLYNFNLSKEQLDNIKAYSAEAQITFSLDWKSLTIVNVCTSKMASTCLNDPCADPKGSDKINQDLKDCVRVFFDDKSCEYEDGALGFVCPRVEREKKITIKILKSCEKAIYQLKEGDQISICLRNSSTKENAQYVGHTNNPVKRISSDLVLDHPIIEYAQYYDGNRNGRFDQADFSSPVTYIDFEKGERVVKGSINVKLVPESVDFRERPQLAEVYKPTVLFPTSDKKLANASFEILLVIPYKGTKISVDGLSLKSNTINSAGIYYINFDNQDLINLGQFKLNITYNMDGIYSIIQRNIKIDPYAREKSIINMRASIMSSKKSEILIIEQKEPKGHDVNSLYIQPISSSNK